jgi:hypothetical protein
MIPLRSHASVRSAYFRELLDARETTITGRYETLADFRDLWREAGAKAHEWRRRATNRWNPAAARWEQGR